MTGATAAVERRIDEQKARITQLEQERNERDRELAEAKDTLQRLQSQLDAHEEQETQKWDEARDAFENFDDEKLTPDNPAVENWAEKLGVTPSELLDEVR
jgi:chromosome segregation ATPase